MWERPQRAAAVAVLVWRRVEMAFAAAVAARTRRYDIGRAPVRSAGVPVVSVGNLAVGGSGKTPMAAWLAAWFLRRGVPRHRDQRLRSRRGAAAPAMESGCAGCRRPHRARAAAAVVERGAQVVVLDDGFQHRALARDLELVLVAAEHPTPVRLLPRGPYREPEKSLSRADGVIVTRRIASFREARSRAQALAAAHGRRFVLVRLEASRWTDLTGARAHAPEGPVLVLSGIARPWEFHGLIEREFPGMEMESMVFSDHHRYSAADIAAVARRARGRPVVTTAKDAVKLQQLSEPGVDARVLHLDVVVERGRRWLEDALGEVCGIDGGTGKEAISPGAGCGPGRLGGGSPR